MARFNHKETPAFKARMRTIKVPPLGDRRAEHSTEQRAKAEERVVFKARIAELRELMVCSKVPEHRELYRREIARLKDEMRRCVPARLGQVYLIEAVGSGRCKVGFTSGDVRYRANDLVTGCPFPIQLRGVMLGTRLDERRIHQKFAHLRVHNEWFLLADELLSAFA